MFSEDARFVAGTPFSVDIIRSWGTDLEKGEKSIGLFADGQILVAFTWSEADAVANALIETTGVARNG